MRKAVKPPSEWLRLICRDWAAENEILVETTDAKFLDYKPYLKGLLSSQLLCRLSIPAIKDGMDVSGSHSLDFWEILGVSDSFDRAYITAQIERFCFLYRIRGSLDENDAIFNPDLSSPDATALAAAAAAGFDVSQNGNVVPLPSYGNIDPSTSTAATAGATPGDTSKAYNRQYPESRIACRDSDSTDSDRRYGTKREHQRYSQSKKDQRSREREVIAVRKATERAIREASREERRRRKVEIRRQREIFAQQQKEAALKRAAELVASNRVPIEITRGAAAAKAAAQAALQAGGISPPPEEDNEAGKKQRSAIVVSNAGDLHQIVTHSKNLWAKYNAIAKEHNQKVNWITVAKELGIHVKVREKYARMHARAEQRGFDWDACRHWKIKDHPEIFMEPTSAEQKAKMPPPPPDANSTVLIDGNREVTAEAIAAAAAVVDASVNPPPVDTVVQTTEEQTAAAAAVAATLVADPTAGSYSDPHDDNQV